MEEVFSISLAPPMFPLTPVTDFFLCFLKCFKILEDLKRCESNITVGKVILWLIYLDHKFHEIRKELRSPPAIICKGRISS